MLVIDRSIVEKKKEKSTYSSIVALRTLVMPGTQDVLYLKSLKGSALYIKKEKKGKPL